MGWPDAYEFRELDSDRLPDARVLLEDTGMYFCDHGGSGKAYLGQVVALLVSQLGSVLVQEYEQ